MNGDISDHAKAILLLTAPLLVGGRGRRTRGTKSRWEAPRPLTPTEYRRLAARLDEAGWEPGNLLGRDAMETLRDVASDVDPDRMERLLDRGFLLAQAVERWRARAIWVVARPDPDYPQRLEQLMPENAPAVLYGCGDRSMLNEGGLAVVGSRKVDDQLREYAADAGRLAADADKAIVSGGARGIDQAAMWGSLENGGRSVGILANGLERAALNRDNRAFLLDEQLVLASPYDPQSRFLVGYAMARNKLIYALSDASLVVNSDHGHGGTWQGATEQLSKLRFVPVYVRAEGGGREGLDALLDRGAKPWPKPETPDELRRILKGEDLAADESHEANPPPESDQYAFALSPPLMSRERKKDRSTDEDGAPTEDQAPTTSAESQATVPALPDLAGPERLLAALSVDPDRNGMSRAEILEALGLKAWGHLKKRYLDPCLGEGWIEMTMPEKPRSPKQRFRLTRKGQDLLNELERQAP